MKKAICITATLCLVLSLVGCWKVKYPDLPDDAIEFEMGVYTDDDTSYRTIEYEGRTYIPYGTIKKTLQKSDVDACIGYVVQDGKKDTEERV